MRLFKMIKKNKFFQDPKYLVIHMAALYQFYIFGGRVFKENLFKKIMEDLN